MCKGWNNINNYNSAVNGRIWICWNPKRVRVKLVVEHEHVMMCEVLDVYSGNSQLLIVVYALNTMVNRKILWEFVTRCLQNALCPVLIGGDFNAIISSEDRYQGNIIHSGDVEIFKTVFKRMISKKLEQLAHSLLGPIIKQVLREFVEILIVVLLMSNGYLNFLTWLWRDLKGMCLIIALSFYVLKIVLPRKESSNFTM